MKVRHIKRRAQVKQRRGIAYRQFNESMRRFAEQLSKSLFGVLGKGREFSETVFAVFKSFADEKQLKIGTTNDPHH